MENNLLPETQAPASIPNPKPPRQRLGKVARLPKPIRDQINLLLQDGFPYAEIILRLGPDAAHLSENNLSAWKNGGYQDWLRQQLLLDQVHSRFELAQELLNADPQSSLQDACRTLATSQLWQVLFGFDPASLLDQLHEKPEIYSRLISALARLSRNAPAPRSSDAPNPLRPFSLKSLQNFTQNLTPH